MEKYMMGFDGSMELPPIPDNVTLGPWVLFKGDLTAAIGPWGTSYAGNLTPHETGIGNWTLNQFTKALREAKFKGLKNGRPMMPPMPRHYAYLTDADIEAIFTYLKSIEPIENLVPGYQPPSS
ncbi:MAG: c-type cytochrome [Maribacter sp.]